MKTKHTIMASALRMPIITLALSSLAATGLSQAQTLNGTQGVNMGSNANGTIFNNNPITTPDGTTITWDTTASLQSTVVPAGQLTGFDQTGAPLQWEDLLPLKVTKVEVMAGAAGAAPTGSSVLIDQAGIATSALSILDAATSTQVPVSVTNGVMSVNGHPLALAAEAISDIYEDKVSATYLGYVPSQTATAATAPAMITIEGLEYTKATTTTFSSNGNSYAVYTTSAVVSPPETKYASWTACYAAAKNLGGYLATFPTREEWVAVFDGALVSITNSCWMGMRGVPLGEVSLHASAFTYPSIQWITGERSRVSWEDGAQPGANKFTNFSNAEPNDYDGAYVALTGKSDDPDSFSESCIHTKSQFIGASTLFGQGTAHAWNDFVVSGEDVVNGFIVEFEQ